MGRYIEKLPPLISVKGIRIFLGHARFYRSFIKDFSKIAKPLSNILVQGVSFEFDKQCNQAFYTLKEKLVSVLIVVTIDWKLPFEIICDVSDYDVGAVLRPKNDRVFYSIYYASRTLSEAQLNYATTKNRTIGYSVCF